MLIHQSISLFYLSMLNNNNFKNLNYHFIAFVHHQLYHPHLSDLLTVTGALIDSSLCTQKLICQLLWEYSTGYSEPREVLGLRLEAHSGNACWILR